MKLYATVASERATKGQGGNEHLEMNINVMSDSPTYRVRVINDELLGIVYITLETLLFEKWRVVYETKQFYNVEAKDKKAYCFQCSPDGKYTIKGVCNVCEGINKRSDDQEKGKQQKGEEMETEYKTVRHY